MIKPEKIINIGKYKIDVSNISVKRKRIAVKDWYNLFDVVVGEDGEPELDNHGNPKKKKNAKKKTEKQATRGLLRIGLYLIRQDLKILNRRFKLTDAIKEFFKRYLISVRYIESLTPEEMNSFVEWVYEYITGHKKKVEDLVKPTMDQLGDLVEEMSPDEISGLAIYLASCCLEQVRQYQSLKAGAKRA